MLVLDEIAEVLWMLHGRHQPQPINSSVAFEDQFPMGLDIDMWRCLERHLEVILPPLELDEVGHCYLPEGLVTIWDFANYVAWYRPDWDPPCQFTFVAWREAQIFAGVRHMLCDALSVEADEVVRSARLMGDLGAE
ncbi:MAG: hypothetical protein O2955_15115 [Planctomycetota bacterium]|nr:hypothetical protein [Planctomycetota bacterium]MDA1213845.1 hypothetical protein [Planctomycetota bacterium]